MFPQARKAILTLALALSLVLGVSSAQAVSLAIPNSGFETPCSLPGVPSFPCNWGGTSGSTIGWDNVTTPHNGNASLALKSVGTPGIDAISTCIPASPSTTYNLLVWYRTTAAVASVSMYFNTYMGSGCPLPPFAPPGAVTNSPNTTGNWTPLTGQATTGAMDQSVKVVLSFTCSGGCPAGAQVNFDDVAAQTEAIAVTVASFSARPAAKGVLLRWRTGTEADLLGFQVYRSRGHSWRRITPSLIAAKGFVSGASYSFLDRTARRGIHYRYRIKAVNRDGTSSWFGPVRVT
jgi:hypothetical protein